MKNEQPEYSKTLTAFAIFQVLIVTLVFFIFTLFGLDTEIFAYLIPATYGLAGFTFVFYYNKAKLENSIKLKYEYERKMIMLKKKQGLYSQEELQNSVDMAIEEGAMSIRDEINTTIDSSTIDQENNIQGV